jgi:hypothetical protein
MGAEVNHFETKFIKSTFYLTFPIVNLARFQPPKHRLDPKLGGGGLGGQNGVVVALQPQQHDLAKITKQKLKSTSIFGGISYFWTCQLDPEGPGSYVFMELQSVNFTHALLF